MRAELSPWSSFPPVRGLGGFVPPEITGEKIGKAVAEVKKLCVAIEIEFQKLAD